MEAVLMKTKDAMLELAKRWRELAKDSEPSVRDAKIACAEELELHFVPKKRARGKRAA